MTDKPVQPAQEQKAIPALLLESQQVVHIEINGKTEHYIAPNKPLDDILIGELRPAPVFQANYLLSSVVDENRRANKQPRSLIDKGE